MKKIYIPVYLIEWSDVRPYVYAAGRGIRTAALFVWAKLCLYMPIVLHYLKVWGLLCLKYIWKFLRLLAHGFMRLLSATWQLIVGIFTMGSPRGSEVEDDDDDDDDDAGESESGQQEETKVVRQRTIFDDED